MTTTTLDIDKLQSLATTIRVLSAEAVEKANSGHPGLPMGAADCAALLWSYYLEFNPKDPEWLGRDSFVLSAGHGSMLLYTMLHLFGYEVSKDDLMSFRQWESITPGHPEYGMTPGVECTTGPLGQGFANGVGLALSQKKLAQMYSPDLFAGKVYAIVSDGDLMEGVASEAASLAGHLELGNIIYLYDDNKISLADPTDVCFTENVPDRFRAYGWHVQSCDGHDFAALAQAIDAAKAETAQPSIVCMRTTIGYGSPSKAGTAGVHGSPLGADELQATKEKLGVADREPFLVPAEVAEFCSQQIEKKAAVYQRWQDHYASWKGANASADTKLRQQQERHLPGELKTDLVKTFEGADKAATRELSGKAIQVIAKHLPYFVGGAADLEPSTKTLIKDDTDFSAKDAGGRNIRFGVREHAMGAMVNGMAYTQKWIPYGATFLVFSDYMRGAVRVAALSHLQSLFIFTHDSFWVGEDGPTHEPIEHVQSLRLIPNLYVFRPADGLEVAMCYYKALEMKKAPSALVFTRQGVPPLTRSNDFHPDQIMQGGYVVSGAEHQDLVLVATGSEVGLAVEAAAILAEKGTPARVVSLPCVDLFLELSEKERDAIIPKEAKKVSLEAGVTYGWERIVGDGLKIGIDHYGASAPGGLLAEKFGFTAPSVVEKITGWL